MPNTNEITKEQLIIDIKLLVSTKGEDVPFNPKYIEYFEFDELMDIKNQLEGIKENNKMPSKDLLDDIFNSCS